MFINISRKYSKILLVLLFLSLHASADHEHGSQIFHAFTMEADGGLGKNHPISTWDFDGWIGGDYHKLWLKSEGEINDSEIEQAEFWAMYSRNIATFWDLQAGIRYDTDPESIGYLVIGISGLAPYFFETEIHLFVSDAGDVSARLRQENEFLITQRLIITPYIEANFYAQDVDELDVGAGLSDAEIGIQTRYEFFRKFAPYFDLRYERKFGETAAIARKNHETYEELIPSIGIRLMF